MQLLASLIGALILAQGVFGLVYPSGFAGVLSGMQIPPALYVATMIRMAVGLTLIVAASSSRAPWTMRGLGMLITVAGAATPLIGETFARPVLRWWAEGGDPIVRIWAGLVFALGAFVLYANFPVRGRTKKRDAEPPDFQ